MNSNYNIINKLLDKNINILYECTNQYYDEIIKLLPFSIISTTNSNHVQFYYDCAMINSWQKHITDRSNIISNYQIIDILTFHDQCPNKFKKEDKIILNNNLKTAYKIFPTNHIYKSWGLTDKLSLQINYGIPSITKDVVKNKHILVINTIKDSTIFSIYSYIKKVYPDTDLVTDIDDQYLHKLCGAGIVLDLTNNTYNNLLCVACGCQLITNLFVDDNLVSPIITNDIGNIVNILNNTQLLYNQNILIKKDQKYIQNSYNIDQFIENITKLLQQIKMEPFVL